MKLLPVAGRELRVAARRRGTWGVRFAAAGLAIVASALVLLNAHGAAPAQQAQALFASLAGFAFLYALVGGAVITSDCVSEEKREGTLGLLFLTSLRGYDVVAGKVVAHSVRTVSALVAIVPVIALPLMLGGIDPAMVGRVAAVLANTMFLSLAIGVFVSVLARDSRQAVGWALGLVGFLVVVIPVLRWLWVEYVLVDLLHRWNRGDAATEPLLGLFLVNPAALLAWGLEALGLFGPARLRPEFWEALAVQHGLAWLLFAAACVVLPRSWRDRVDDRRGGVRGGAATAAGGQRRGGWIQGEPFAWIVARERRSALSYWVGLGVIAVIWLWGFLELREEWLQALVALWTLFIAALWLKLRVTATACRHLHEHRRSGSFELVLCTLETPGTIVRGYLQGLRDQVFGPLVAVLASAVFLFVAAAGQDRLGADTFEVLLTLLAGMGILLLDLWTLAWTGMWMGLCSSRYVRAWALTIVLVLLLPWVVYLTSVVAGGVFLELTGVGASVDPGFGSLLVWWILLAAGVDLFLLGWARRRLDERFREAVAGAATGPGAAGKQS